MTINNDIKKQYDSMSGALVRLFLNEAGMEASINFLREYEALFAFSSASKEHSMEDVNDAIEEIIEGLGEQHKVSMLLRSALQYDY